MSGAGRARGRRRPASRGAAARSRSRGGRSRSRGARKPIKEYIVKGPTSTTWKTCDLCHDVDQPTSFCIFTCDDGENMAGAQLCGGCAVKMSHNKLDSSNPPEEMPVKEAMKRFNKTRLQKGGAEVPEMLAIRPLRKRKPKPNRLFRWRQRPNLVSEMQQFMVRHLPDVPVRGFVDSLDEAMRHKALDAIIKYNPSLSERFTEMIPTVALDPTLEVIDWAGCRMNDVDIEVASYFATLDAPVTHTLRLCNNPMGSRAALGVAQAVFLTRHLRTLDLSWCKLGPEGVAVLADAFVDNKTITSLNLCGNYLDDRAGGAPLADLVRDNEGIKDLNVSFNSLLPRGVAVFCKGLAQNRTLTRLGMRRCDIGAQGATSLAKALTLRDRAAAGPPFVELNAADSNIGAEGAVALAAFLRVRIPAAIRMVDPESLALERGSRAREIRLRQEAAAAERAARAKAAAEARQKAKADAEAAEAAAAKAEADEAAAKEAAETEAKLTAERERKRKADEAAKLMADAKAEAQRLREKRLQEKAEAERKAKEEAEERARAHYTAKYGTPPKDVAEMRMRERDSRMAELGQGFNKSQSAWGKEAFAYAVSPEPERLDADAAGGKTGAEIVAERQSAFAAAATPEEHAAATAIQARHRGGHDRFLRRVDKSARLIQRCGRGMLGRKAARRERSAHVIQRTVRGSLGRRRAKEKMERLQTVAHEVRLIVGRRVIKSESGSSGHVLTGGVVESYAATTKLYNIAYDDGRAESLPIDALHTMLHPLNFPDDLAATSFLGMSVTRERLDEEEENFLEVHGHVESVAPALPEIDEWGREVIRTERGNDQDAIVTVATANVVYSDGSGETFASIADLYEVLDHPGRLDAIPLLGRTVQRAALPQWTAAGELKYPEEATVVGKVEAYLHMQKKGALRVTFSDGTVELMGHRAVIYLLVPTPEEMEIQSEASTLIQKIARRILAKREVERRREGKHKVDAATLVQRVARGRLARVNVSEKRRRAEKRGMMRRSSRKVNSEFSMQMRTMRPVDLMRLVTEAHIKEILYTELLDAGSAMVIDIVTAMVDPRMTSRAERRASVVADTSAADVDAARATVAREETGAGAPPRRRSAADYSAAKLLGKTGLAGIVKSASRDMTPARRVVADPFFRHRLHDITRESVRATLADVVRHELYEGNMMALARASDTPLATVLAHWLDATFRETPREWLSDEQTDAAISTSIPVRDAEAFVYPSEYGRGGGDGDDETVILLDRRLHKKDLRTMRDAMQWEPADVGANAAAEAAKAAEAARPGASFKYAGIDTNELDPDEPVKTKAQLEAEAAAIAAATQERSDTEMVMTAVARVLGKGTGRDDVIHMLGGRASYLQEDVEELKPWTSPLAVVDDILELVQANRAAFQRLSKADAPKPAVCLFADWIERFAAAAEPLLPSTKSYKATWTRAKDHSVPAPPRQGAPGAPSGGPSSGGAHSPPTKRPMPTGPRRSPADAGGGAAVAAGAGADGGDSTAWA